MVCVERVQLLSELAQDGSAADFVQSSHSLMSVVSSFSVGRRYRTYVLYLKSHLTKARVNDSTSHHIISCAVVVRRARIVETKKMRFFKNRNHSFPVSRRQFPGINLHFSATGLQVLRDLSKTETTGFPFPEDCFPGSNCVFPRPDYGSFRYLSVP